MSWLEGGLPRNELPGRIHFRQPPDGVGDVLRDVAGEGIGLRDVVEQDCEEVWIEAVHLDIEERQSVDDVGDGLVLVIDKK